MVTVLLINGSLRAGSTNGAALKTAAAVAPPGSHAVMYGGLGELPHFNPDVEQGVLPEPVVELRAQLRAADAVLFSTPEYAGGLPGSFKNLLDWTVGEGLHAKVVGWVNSSAHAGGAEHAHAMLRTVLGYVNADVVEAACVRAYVRRDTVGADGTVSNPAARQAIGAAMHALVERVNQLRSS
jgi:chromate reductase, NAD(P)H dehydrogenase (quinone)